MKCQLCKSNNATTHYTEIVNGVKKELYLCPQCAAQLQNQDGGFFDFNQMLTNMFFPVSSRGAVTRCPVCGADESYIAKTCRAGCAECYNTFDGLLGPYIKKLHSNEPYKGKIPLCAGKELKKKRSIAELKSQLDAAVGRQEYEKAAELRDKIRELEGGNDNA